MNTSRALLQGNVALLSTCVAEGCAGLIKRRISDEILGKNIGFARKQMTVSSSAW